MEGLHKVRQLKPEVARLAQEARDAILRRARVKPYLIVLFGSEARGEATPESDIDILVVLEEVNREVKDELHDAVYDVMWEHDFDRRISLTTMSRQDFEEERREGYSFIRNVEEDGIVLWRADAADADLRIRQAEEFVTEIQKILPEQPPADEG